MLYSLSEVNVQSLAVAEANRITNRMNLQNTFCLFSSSASDFLFSLNFFSSSSQRERILEGRGEDEESSEERCSNHSSILRLSLFRSFHALIVDLVISFLQ